MKIAKIVLVILVVAVTQLLIAFNNTLEVHTDIPGVSVYLGNEYLGQTRGFDTINILTKDNIRPGRHRLVCKYEGYSDNMQEINMPQEGTIKIVVDFLLKEIKAESITDEGRGELIKRTGTIIVRSRPTGADIFLNGVKSNTPTDARIPDYPIGNIALRCAYGQNRMLEANFYLSAEDTVRVMADFIDNKIQVFVRYKVTISSEPEGMITVNGRTIGQGPQSLRLERGTYDLNISRKGYKSLSRKINVTTEDLFTYKLELNSAPVQINSSPVNGARVFINDKLVGTTPYKDELLDAGTHTVRIEIEKYLPVRDNINVVTGRPLTKNFSLEKNVGTLKVTANDSEIRINDQEAGKNRLTTELEPGRYRVTAVRDRHLSDTQEIVVTLNRTTDVQLTPKPIEGTITILAEDLMSKEKKYIENIPLLFNNQKTSYRTSRPVTMLIGTYDVGLDSDAYIVRKKPKNIEITRGSNPNVIFQVESLQSIHDKANFWRTNKWAAFTGTAIAVAGAVYFDLEGQKYLDEYTSTVEPIFRKDAWVNSEKSFDNRDLFVYVSIVPAGYTLFSWIRQASYNRKLR